MNKIIEAVNFAIEKHGSQRYGKYPYIKHCMEVAQELIDNKALNWWCNAEGKNPPEENIIIAILHDTMEDTNATFEEITFKFGLGIAKCVQFLSKDKSETTERYYDKVNFFEVGLQVKTADRLCNIRNIKKGEGYFVQEVLPRYKEEIKYYGKFQDIIKQAIESKEKELE